MPNSQRNELLTANISIRLATEDNLGVASALLTKTDTPCELSLEVLENLIEAQGYGSWKRIPNATEEIIKSFAAEEEATIVFATRVNASWEFTVSADHMVVEIDAQPAMGGTGLDAKLLETELLALNVDPKRINRRALKKLVSASERTIKIVAAGQAT